MIGKEFKAEIEELIAGLKTDDPQARIKMKKKAEEKGRNGFSIIFDVVREVEKNLNKALIVPVRDALKNNQGAFELRDKLREVTSPSLADDIAKTYDNVSRRINQFSPESEYLVKRVRSDSDKGKQELVHDERHVRLLYHTMRLFGKMQTTLETSRLYHLVTPILARMNINNEKLKIIVIIAFGITAVGYFVYQLNQPQAQQVSIPETKQYEYAFNPPSPPIQNITRQFLALVISASTIDFIKSIKIKRSIDVNDGEKFYEMTKYLWLGSESVLNQNRYNINRYLVSKGEESEYDIYLVYFELKQGDEGFKPNANQLARHDAFIKLSDLAVNFEISPRLKMEAYENFEVYNC